MRVGGLYAAFPRARRVRWSPLKDALLTGVDLPALDGASREAARTTLTIEPERVVPTTATSQRATTAKDKVALASSFRVTLSAASPSLVSSVSSPGFRVETADDDLGLDRTATKAPTSKEVLPLRIVMPDARAADWTAWAQATFAGTAGGGERDLTIEYMAADLKTALWTVRYTGVGVYGGDVFLPAATASGDTIPRREFLLYAETMQLT